MNKRKETITRRGFLKGIGTAAVGPYVVPASVFGANDKITVGTVGVGPQGRSVMEVFLASADARVVAVCDVNALRREDARRHVDQFYGGTDPLVARTQAVSECGFLFGVQASA